MVPWNKYFVQLLFCPPIRLLLVPSYVKNIGIRRATSSGNIEEQDIFWQPQIKDSVKIYLDPFQLLFYYFKMK